MNLPRLVTNGTGHEQRLLRAARSDGPNSHLKERVLLSVSLGTVIIAEGTASDAASAQLSHEGSFASKSVVVAGNSGTASVAAAAMWPVLVKWVGIAGVALCAGVGAGFTAGTTMAANRETRESLSVSIDTPTPFAVANSTVTTPSMAKRVAMTTESADLSLPQSPRPGSSVARNRNLPAKEASNPVVPSEVQLVDAARSALRAGDATHCLELLAERRHRFPRGVLGPEAALVQIEALNLSGQHDSARQHGMKFLAEYPSGPLANRVRALLGIRSATLPESATEVM